VVQLLLVVLVLLLPARDAWAYLDPGTGSFMLQAVIALAMGALLAMRQYWARLKTIFSSRRGDEPESDGE
jgi:hypothetical protein